MAAPSPALLEAIYSELWQLDACNAVLADPYSALVHSGLDELPEGWEDHVGGKVNQHIGELKRLGYTVEEARKVWEEAVL